MLHLHHSNRLEGLVDELTALLAVPSGSVLEPETVVVQNQGMERWLMQQLAQGQGIAANIDFPLPATFIWRIFESQLGELPRNSVFDKDSLLWRVMGLLPTLLPQSDFQPLERYLQGDENGLKAYQLCGRVADLFDQYLVYRSEMILGWEHASGVHDQGDMFAPAPVHASDWQARLWKALVDDTDGQHRARLWETFFNLKQLDPTSLPRRINVFGLSAMAPNYVQVIARLAEVVDVHIFLLNPCREYWADIVDNKGQAKKRAAWRRQGKEDVSGLLDVGNPLLASMGHVGQVFVDQLLELNAAEQTSFESPLDENSQLLQQLQADVLELIDRRTVHPEQRMVIAQSDQSVQLNVCHSPMREVQVLQDRLLKQFDELDGLEPREIVVMAPNIESYAPYIEAVFGSRYPDQNDGQHIPWSIADLSIAVESPLLESFHLLLRLPESRFDASELMAYLDVPAIARRFGIVDDALPRIRQWVSETAIRWGLDGTMRADMGLPHDPANTWEAGLQRLFLGYAMAPGDTLFADVLPYEHMEGNEVEDLGRLQAFVVALSQWRKRLDVTVDLPTWSQSISALLAGFYQPDSSEECVLQTIRSGLDDVSACASRAEFEGEITLPVIRHHLDQVLADNSQTRRFLAGGVTFCNMVPMRSIPFRVVCLLGMNDSDFPRDQRPLGFDLIAAHPKHTDRSRRLDDRYLFLEAMLSARDLFYISYVGYDIRDNSEKIPSVVISELLEYIALSFEADHLVTPHPLQPFSKDYYRTEQSSPLFSYDRYWLSAADVACQQESLFADEKIPFEDTKKIDLNDLIKFLLNPSEWFLRRRLGVTYGGGDEVLEDLEPFKMDALDRYALRQDALDNLLADQPLDVLEKRARAQGLLPHGMLGKIDFDDAMSELDGIVARLSPRLTQRVPALEIDLKIDGMNVNGWLNHLRQEGQVVYRTSTLKAKDQISLWVKHLCLNAQLGGGQSSVHVAEDQTIKFAPIDKGEATALLGVLLGVWQAGQSHPLKFYPATSLAYIAGTESGHKEDKIARDMNKAWSSGFGEAINPYIRTAQRGGEALAEPFPLWSDTVLLPMVTARELIKAKDDL